MSGSAPLRASGREVAVLALRRGEWPMFGFEPNDEQKMLVDWSSATP